jgi:acyl carrier protein|tara:strand:- start:501 stop:749 length:249 start_codon:yes stop_codon:yes gene_type:complete
MTIEAKVISILNHTLSIDPETESLTLDSELLGVIPEFDSMAVVSVITALEEELGVLIDDDELDAEVFATVASLVEFVENKKS